jgi:hypothetical protein
MRSTEITKRQAKINISPLYDFMQRILFASG